MPPTQKSPDSRGPSDHGRGFFFGASAYLIWGAFPLYFPLLEPAGATEILAYRVLWSALTMLLVLLAMRKLAELRALLANRRSRTFLALASATIAINWGTYIYGVNNGAVVEASLGYFINPLVTVLMGVLLLGERLRRWQWVAMAIATIAVLGLALDYGRPPWIALILAFSFGTYGLSKKQANAGAAESLTFETLALSPIAIGYVVWLAIQGQQNFTGHGVSHALLLSSTGVVTAIPLLLFGAAATRIPLSSLGLLQYLAPIFQFILGVVVFGESMSSARWWGFVMVWIALVIFTIEALAHRRRDLRLAAEASSL